MLSELNSQTLLQLSTHTEVPFQPPAELMQATASNQVLIIDDSNQICSLLVSAIVGRCAEAGRTVHVIQSSELGMIETLPMVFSNSDEYEPLTIYTANSPRNALPVLRLNYLHSLTIVADIMTPADTQVGLLGMLKEITERQLPVNLLFASSEGQNRYYVEQLITTGKAYFLKKGSSAWADLPIALATRGDMFNFKKIARRDYDSGVLNDKAEPEIKTKPKRSWWHFLTFWRRSYVS